MCRPDELQAHLRLQDAMYPGHRAAVCPDCPPEPAASERARMRECQSVCQLPVRLPRVSLLSEPCRVQMALLVRASSEPQALRRVLQRRVRWGWTL